MRRLLREWHWQQLTGPLAELQLLVAEEGERLVTRHRNAGVEVRMGIKMKRVMPGGFCEDVRLLIDPVSLVSLLFNRKTSS